jgi:hypothetical protein
MDVQQSTMSVLKRQDRYYRSKSENNSDVSKKKTGIRINV